MKKTFACCVVAAFLMALPARAGIIQTEIDEDEISLEINLVGGIGLDLTLSFEQVVGLSLQNLGLSAKLVGLLDLGLLRRLPSGVSLAGALPVLLTVEPPASGGLSFSGVVSLSLHTHELAFVGGSPLRFFAAPKGGRFVDVTASMGTGSYRARGARGDFSQFLIGIDLRSVDAVIDDKFRLLGELLADHEAEITPAVFDAIEALYDAALDAYDADQVLDAIDEIEAFGAAVEAASGADIPDVWRSARDLDNVAGELRAQAETLRFSLQLKAAGGGLGGLL